MNNYVDMLGRVHTKPVTPNDDFPTNNAWIYTAIYETLRRMNDEESECIHYGAINRCEVKFGLFSRHPMPYRSQPNMTPVSHDEIIGIAMISQMHAMDIKDVRGAYFCDIIGYEFKLTPNPIKIPVALASYLYRVLVKKENQRRITRQYPDLFGIFFTHRRQYRFIYEYLATGRAGLINTFCWTMARMFDCTMDDVSLLHYMAIIRMEQIHGRRRGIFTQVADIVRIFVKLKYGEKALGKMLREYLLKNTGVVDENHPWLIEIKKYEGE